MDQAVLQRNAGHYRPPAPDMLGRSSREPVTRLAEAHIRIASSGRHIPG